MDIRDTQTGLKGVPTELIYRLIEAPGERYEYATSVLLEVHKAKVPIIQFDIRTIYIDNNASSHFNPLVDSIRIYSLLFKYMLSSLSAFIVDIVIFSIADSVLSAAGVKNDIIYSTYIAKVISCTYTFFINKRLVFENNKSTTVTAIKFVTLCVVQSTLSAICTSGLYILTMWNKTIAKIIVDTILFFFSFQVQQRWVFKENNRKNAIYERRM
jgi:dolichol-phosphate mannosyltransferase